MRAVVLLAVAVLAMLAALDGRAIADEDPDTEIARRHFERAMALYAVSDYAAALPELEAARARRPSPALDYNIARCLDRMDRPVDAIAAYRRYVESRPEPPDAAEVRHRVVELEAIVARASEPLVARASEPLVARSPEPLVARAPEPLVARSPELVARPPEAAATSPSPPASPVAAAPPPLVAVAPHVVAPVAAPPVLAPALVASPAAEAPPPPRSHRALVSGVVLGVVTIAGIAALAIGLAATSGDSYPTPTFGGTSVR